ncbi:MAG: hypothetical protein GY772_07060, partial [bacterium]|nr:hypothetical protein [bacterium]
MNPYRIQFIFAWKVGLPVERLPAKFEAMGRTCTCIIGITDQWEPQEAKSKSMSGAKLYINGPPEIINMALRRVIAVLDEEDIQMNGSVMVRVPDNADDLQDWGSPGFSAGDPRREALPDLDTYQAKLWERAGLSPPHPARPEWHERPLAERRMRIHVGFKWCTHVEWPRNSVMRKMLATAALRVGQELTRDMLRAWEQQLDDGEGGEFVVPTAAVPGSAGGPGLSAGSPTASQAAATEAEAASPGLPPSLVAASLPAAPATVEPTVAEAAPSTEREDIAQEVDAAVA